MAKIIRKSTAEPKHKELKNPPKFLVDEGKRSPKEQFGAKKKARKS